MLAFKIFPIFAMVVSVFGLPTGVNSGAQLIARASVLTETHTGDATFFEPGLGACGKTNGPNDLIAAASHELFDTFPGATANPNNNPICGRSVTAHANGKSVTVKIVDRCAGCSGEGDLDFSPAAFEHLAALSVGRIHGMTWKFN
ncbi:plant expansin [Schizopora paradoxa]|uniref:Plant expansin n=1 Tax=Schizopora paradoxa TaxID=27342 RepID=A0A0H2S4Z7_9AGAM|nr:plant expansin [Schizopora paradoxa]